MEDTILKDLVKTRNVLRDKYKTLVLGQSDLANRLEETFKPITNPIKELIEHTKLKTNASKNVPFDVRLKKEESNDKRKIEFETSTPLTKKRFSNQNNDDYDDFDESVSYKSFESNLENNDINDDLQENNSTLSNLTELENRKKLDTVYGAHKGKDGKWRFGNTAFTITDDKIIIGQQRWNLTPGLFQLLFHKNPKNYDKTELALYKKILLQTNTHHRNYDPKQQIKGNSSKKYRKIIKNLIYNKSDEVDHSLKNNQSKNISGLGIMEFTSKKPNFIYWDDPNELVDRLRLLISSQSAGHNNHNNEIVSIIEELKEAELIK